MNRNVRSPSKPPKFSGPPRVRYEPPTIEEAVFAAQGLASEVEQQVAIVVGLTGMSEKPGPSSHPECLSKAGALAS